MSELMNLSYGLHVYISGTAQSRTLIERVRQAVANNVDLAISVDEVHVHFDNHGGDLMSCEHTVLPSVGFRIKASHVHAINHAIDKVIGRVRVH